LCVLLRKKIHLNNRAAIDEDYKIPDPRKIATVQVARRGLFAGRLARECGRMAYTRSTERTNTRTRRATQNIEYKK